MDDHHENVLSALTERSLSPAGEHSSCGREHRHTRWISIRKNDLHVCDDDDDDVSQRTCLIGQTETPPLPLWFWTWIGPSLIWASFRRSQWSDRFWFRDDSDKFRSCWEIPQPGSTDEGNAELALDLILDDDININCDGAPCRWTELKERSSMRRSHWREWVFKKSY